MYRNLQRLVHVNVPIANHAIRLLNLSLQRQHCNFLPPVLQQSSCYGAMQYRCSALVMSSLASLVQDSATECASTLQLSMCHELTSIKVSSSISSLLGVPGCRAWPPPPPAVAPLPPTPAPATVPADALGILNRPCGCPKADLVMVAAMPGTVTSMVLRGRCKSPATPWGATPTDRSPVPLHLLHWFASVYHGSICVITVGK